MSAEDSLSFTRAAIVHGDLTHKDVLIYKSKFDSPGFPLTAKLSDFSGSVMDIASNEKHSLRMTTWPYSASELGCWLTDDGVKTDVYSFELFIWRTVIDCKNILEIFEFNGERTSQAESRVAEMKLGDAFLLGAKKSINAPDDIPAYLQKVNEKNDREKEADRSSAPVS
ncbi:MAG: hypothetical protein M1834_000109 [Cirrosporium novae-zelandiae]|nr:MAG: hypothetical protein M1834_000109 [Cirrosporium novae-zelandiae]